jgi:hypothetical protein
MLSETSGVKFSSVNATKIVATPVHVSSSFLLQKASVCVDVMLVISNLKACFVLNNSSAKSIVHNDNVQFA